MSGLLTNTAGTTTNAGQLNGGATVTGGTLTNDNLISGTVTISGTGTVANNLTITGAVDNAATFNNNAFGTVSGLLTNSAGTTTNAGQLNGGAAVSAGSLTNNNLVSGTVAISGTGTVANNLTITGAVDNAATFNNNAFGTVSGLLTNSAGTTTNAGQLNGGATVTGGTLTTTGSISGGLTNSATVNANGGSIDGAIANIGTFNVGGTVTSNSTFGNSAVAARLLVNTGAYTITGMLTNSGTNASGGILVTNGATLNANGGITNNAGGTIVNNGTINDYLNNAGSVTNNLTYNASVTTNTGTITNSAPGTWTGNVVSNANTINNNTGATWIGDATSAGTLNNAGTWTGTVTNSGTFANTGNGIVSGLFTNTAGTTTNAGQLNGGATVTGGILTNNNLIAGTVTSSGPALVENNHTITGAVNNAATFYNSVNGTVSGLLTNTGVATNYGQLNGGVTLTGDILGNNNLIVGTVAATGTAFVTNNLTITGAVNNAATFSNMVGATVSGLLSNTAGVFLNNGALNGGANLSGGTLSGTGSVTNLTVAGGKFAPGSTPGSTMTVSGSLALQSAAQYVVRINPTTVSFASVTGTATLGNATVSAVYANGNYVQRQYTILTAAGGVSGTFASVTNTNLPANLHPVLAYDSTHAYLNLVLNFGIPSNTNANQRSVGDGLTNFFNATGGIPTVFSALSLGGLTQASGESATGTQQTTFNAMNQFMGVMTDPSIAGREDPASPAGASQFADDSDHTAAARTGAERDAYAAMSAKAPGEAFARRWNVWTAGYGGSQTTQGNATIGTSTASSRIFGAAVGADYRFSPFTLAGFALAGGGTSFAVNGAGSGRSDLFQAGAYLRHIIGTGLHLHGAGLRLAGRQLGSNRDPCRRRSPACTVQRQRILGPGRRRLPLHDPVDDRRHALRSRPVHDVRTAGLCRKRGVGRQHLRAGLYRQERHGLAQRTRPAQRPDLRAAGRHPDPARPRRLGARLQRQPQHRRDLPDAARRVLYRQRRGAGA